MASFRTSDLILIAVENYISHQILLDSTGVIDDFAGKCQRRLPMLSSNHFNLFTVSQRESLFEHA